MLISQYDKEEALASVISSRVPIDEDRIVPKHFRTKSVVQFAGKEEPLPDFIRLLGAPSQSFTEKMDEQTDIHSWNGAVLLNSSSEAKDMKSERMSEALSWIRPECYFNVIGEIQRPEFLAARPGRPSKSSHPETETSQPAQASAN